MRIKRVIVREVKQDSAPRVSVLMPAYNAAKYIRESIESVLAQTFTDFELIIVDDCSTDATPELLAAYSDPRIRSVRNPRNLGVAQTRNRAISLARGKYFAILDSDDLSLPTRLAKQVAYLDEHPEIVLVCTQVQELRGGVVTPFDRDNREQILDPLLMEWRLQLHNILCHSSVMFHAEAAGQLGGYREECEYSEDYDFYLRLLAIGGAARLPEVLTTYRIQGGSVSNMRGEQQHANAIRAMASNLVRWFGDDAEDAAELIFRLLRGQNEKTTIQEFSRFGSYLERLLTAFSVAKKLSTESYDRLAEDASYLWWRVASDLAGRGRRGTLRIYSDRSQLARASSHELTLCRLVSSPPVRLLRATARRGKASHLAKTLRCRLL